MSRNTINDVRKYTNELHDLIKKREAIDMEIAYVCAVLRSLAAGLPQKSRDKLLAEVWAHRKPMGLSDAIMQIFRGAGVERSPDNVREQLEARGFDLSGYKQPLTIVSVTLSRLAKSGRIIATRKNRRVTYRWRIPVRPR